jgi:hypothetical protein
VVTVGESTLGALCQAPYSPSGTLEKVKNSVDFWQQKVSAILKVSQTFHSSKTERKF